MKTAKLHVALDDVAVGSLDFKALVEKAGDALVRAATGSYVTISEEEIDAAIETLQSAKLAIKLSGSISLHRDDPAVADPYDTTGPAGAMS